jgi:hypothetical protein
LRWVEFLVFRWYWWMFSWVISDDTTLPMCMRVGMSVYDSVDLVVDFVLAWSRTSTRYGGTSSSGSSWSSNWEINVSQFADLHFCRFLFILRVSRTSTRCEIDSHHDQLFDWFSVMASDSFT